MTWESVKVFNSGFLCNVFQSRKEKTIRGTTYRTVLDRTVPYRSDSYPSLADGALWTHHSVVNRNATLRIPIEHPRILELNAHTILHTRKCLLPVTSPQVYTYIICMFTRWRQAASAKQEGMTKDWRSHHTTLPNNTQFQNRQHVLTKQPALHNNTQHYTTTSTDTQHNPHTQIHTDIHAHHSHTHTHSHAQPYTHTHTHTHTRTHTHAHTPPRHTHTHTHTHHTT